jgi:hypothetical protein
MSDEPKQEDKKIIIDEDWKSQVQAEKEELERKQADDAAKEPEATSPGDQDIQWPEASLSMLVTTLGAQAMMALGLTPHPATGKTEVQLGQAKHFIDTVQLLMDKTEGNREPEETKLMDALLHDLRMSFLAVQQAQGTPE